MHDLPKLVGLARQPVERMCKISVAGLQGVVDLVVGGFERVGRLKNGMTLILETPGDAIYLAQQILRDVFEKFGLTGQAFDSLERLARDVLAGAPDGVNAVHDGLVEFDRLTSNGVAERRGVGIERGCEQ